MGSESGCQPDIRFLERQVGNLTHYCPCVCRTRMRHASQNGPSRTMDGEKVSGVLVPKLCLGTDVSKLCFESRSRRETEIRGRAFPKGVWETGTTPWWRSSTRRQ